VTPHRRLGLCAWVYAYRALAGLLIALPVAAAFGASETMYPRGQAELFDPGGVMFVESLRFVRRSTGIVSAGGSIAILAVLGGVLPLGALIAGLGREGRLPAGFLAGRALRHAGTLALIFGLGLLAQALAGALLGLLGEKFVGALSLSPMREDFAHVAVALVALSAVAAIGIVRDLASVAAVNGGHRFYVATSRALRCMRRMGGRAAVAWSWRSALGLAGIALAAWLAPPLAGAGAGAVLLGAALHQAGIAGAVFGRASWLAAAIRLQQATEPVSEAVPDTVPAPEPVPAEPALEAAPEPEATPAALAPEAPPEEAAAAPPEDHAAVDPPPAA
jgi:hypothetical protein